MSLCVLKNLLVLGVGLFEYVRTERSQNITSKFVTRITRKKNETVLKS